MPLHLVGQEPPATELAVAQLIASEQALWDLYHDWLMALHPSAWMEIRTMARATKKKFFIDLRPAIEELGLKTVVQQIGIEPLVEEIGIKPLVKQIGIKPLVEQIGIDKIFASLSAADRRKLKRLLQEGEREEE